VNQDETRAAHAFEAAQRARGDTWGPDCRRAERRAHRRMLRCAPLGVEKLLSYHVNHSFPAQEQQNASRKKGGTEYDCPNQLRIHCITSKPTPIPSRSFNPHSLVHRLFFDIVLISHRPDPSACCFAMFQPGQSRYQAESIATSDTATSISA
jgi:hypothetical protein